MEADELERGGLARELGEKMTSDKKVRAAGATIRPILQTAPEAASLWRNAHCRRHVTRCSAASLAIYVCIVLCCLQLPPLPTSFSKRFHEKLSLELVLSPQAKILNSPIYEDLM